MEAPLAASGTTVGLAIGLAGLLLGVVGIAATVILDRKRTRDPAATPALGIIRSMRLWRAVNFYRARSAVVSYSEALRRFHRTPDGISVDDLVTWSTQALLASAGRIDPASQGKANLLKVKRWINNGERVALLSSHSFSGIFPLEQVSNRDDQQDALIYRDIEANPDPSRRSPYTVVKCARSNAILLESVRGVERSDDERKLGTTAILGIPITRNLRAEPENAIVAISVDLRMSPARLAFHRWRWNPEKSRRSVLLKRAELVQKIARELVISIKAARTTETANLGA